VAQLEFPMAAVKLIGMACFPILNGEQSSYSLKKIQADSKI